MRIPVLFNPSPAYKSVTGHLCVPVWFHRPHHTVCGVVNLYAGPLNQLNVEGYLEEVRTGYHGAWASWRFHA